MGKHRDNYQDQSHAEDTSDHNGKKGSIEICLQTDDMDRRVHASSDESSYIFIYEIQQRWREIGVEQMKHVAKRWVTLRDAQKRRKQWNIFPGGK